MNDNPLPQEDQQVTLVSVRDGNMYVTSARTLVVKPKKLALELDTTLSQPPEWSDGQSLTMIYTHGDRVMRLRGVLRERIAADRVAVEPVGEVKEGDRRDYRRADVEARVYAKPVPTHSAAEARAIQLATDVPPESPEFITQQVNISGSGLSYESNAAISAGDLLDLRLILERPTNATVSMVGLVVRIIEREGLPNIIAVRFAELSESDQDLIVYTVFSNHFAAAGLGEVLASLDEDDDEV